MLRNQRGVRKAIGANAAIAIALIFILSSCSSTPKTSAPATASVGAAGSRAQLVNDFPANVRPMLTPLPTGLISLLLKVRREGPSQLVFADAGGALHQGFQQAYLNGWEKITGWTVVDATPPVAASLTALQAQVGSGHPQWDIYTSLDDATAAYATKKGDFEKLPLNLVPVSSFPPGTKYDPNGYWTDTNPFGNVLVWNTKTWPLSGPHPTSVLDLFNTTEFPGKRCVYNFLQYGGNLEFAAEAEGIPWSNIYTTLETSSGLNNALHKLGSIYKDLVFGSDGDDTVNNILDGECSLGITWNGRVQARLTQDPSLPLAVTWKDAMMTTGPIAIPRGAPHIDAARSAWAYAMQPAQECATLNILGYGLQYNLPPFPGCLSSLERSVGPQFNQIGGWEDDTFYLNYPQVTNAWTAFLANGG